MTMLAENLKYIQGKVYEIRVLTNLGQQSDNTMERLLFKEVHQQLEYLGSSLGREIRMLIDQSEQKDE